MRAVSFPGSGQEGPFGVLEPADSAPNSSIQVYDKRAGNYGHDHVIQFRRFQIIPGKRELLCEGEHVEVGSRAFDLLLVLVNSRGELVTKEQILDFVWPSTVVEESNLRFQVASLRKVLGEDRDVIKTIPGRGYFFAAEQSIAAIPGRRNEEVPADMLPPASEVDQRLNLDKTEARPWTKTVVVIDDDDSTREALEGLLRSASLQVEAFATVQSFLDADRTHPPGCLVLDVCLPGRSGLEFQADLAKAGLNVPVIFISGHADVHMSVRAMKAGAMEFLTKPVRHQELLEAIQTAISSCAR